MNSFPFAHAGVTPEGPTREWRGWQDLAARCAETLGEAGDGLGLLYVTEPLADDLDAIVDYLHGTTGVPAWSGAVAPAICATGTDYFDTPAMAAMVVDVDPTAYRVIQGTEVRGGEVDFSEVAGWAEANNAHFAIVHADPRGAGVMQIIPGLAHATDAFLVGGLTSAVGDHAQIAGRSTGGGVSGVMFAERVPVTTGLTQGCTPIGPVHTVTGMEEEIITELDGMPALDVFKEDIGELLAHDLKRVAGYIHAAQPVAGSDMIDYMVRNLVGIDAGHGWIAVAASLEIGDRLMFVRRDAASAVEDMARMLDHLKAQAGERVRGAVYHSCVARGPHQFGPGSVEMRMIREAFGDIPVVGFFGNGEISNDRLYTYTGILSLFLEGAGE